MYHVAYSLELEGVCGVCYRPAKERYHVVYPRTQSCQFVGHRGCLPQPSDLDAHRDAKLMMRFKDDYTGDWMTVYGLNEMIYWAFNPHNRFHPERILLFVLRTREYLREGIRWGLK